MKSIAKFWEKLSSSEFGPIPSSLNLSYLPSLDGLRALSIALVIAQHFLSHSRYELLIPGNTGVQIFFGISGFLITTLLLKEKAKTGQIGLKSFYIRRAFRIFPVANLYLFVLIGLNIVFSLHITFASFATAFLYVKNLAPSGITVVNSPGWYTLHFWSLAVEEQFYLLFPFILTWNFKAYLRILIGLILFIPLANLIYYNTSFAATTGVPRTILSIIVALWGRGTTTILWGSLCSILLFKGMLPENILLKYRRVAIYIFALVIVVRMRGFLDWKETVALFITGPAIGLVLLLCIQRGDSLFFRLLNLKPVRTIGILSYSLYIWQEPFTSRRPWANAFPFADSWWLNLAVLVIVSCLSYYLYEKKFLLLKNRFKSSPPAKKPEVINYSIAL
jgi:peptidoglycan/LPS O-acetylase OafA/YrhL